MSWRFVLLLSIMGLAFLLPPLPAAAAKASPAAMTVSERVRSIRAMRAGTLVADARIGNFRKLMRHTTDEAVLERSALDLMSDPLAVRRLNLYGDEAIRKKMNQYVGQVKIETKKLIKQRLKDEIAAKYGDDAVIDFAEWTHDRPGKVHVGQDWDVTVQVKRKIRDKSGRVTKKVIEELPLDRASRVVQESFYQAATGIERPAGGKAAKRFASQAKTFAHKHDVVAINGRHAEAFPEVDKVLRGQRKWLGIGPKVPVDLNDVQHLSLALQHKATLPRNEAFRIMDKAKKKIAELGLAMDDPKALKILQKAEESAYREYVEYARTYNKLFDKHVAPRVKAKGGKVPKEIVAARTAWQDLGDGRISWQDFKDELRTLGQTEDDLMRKTMGLPEAAQKLGKKNNVVRLMTKGAGRALALAPVVGEFGRAYVEEMDQRVWDDQDFTAGGYLDVAHRALDNAIVAPVKALGGLLGDGVESGAEWYYERSRDEGYLRAFGSGSLLIMGTAATAAAHGTGELFEKGANASGEFLYGLHHDTVNTLYESGRKAVSGFFYTTDTIGQVLLVDQAFAPVFYDSHAEVDRAEAFKRFAARVRRKMDGALRDAERKLVELKAHVLKTRPETPEFGNTLRKLSTEYSKSQQLAWTYLERWISHSGRQFAGANNKILEREDKAVAPLLARLEALPANPLSFIADPEFVNSLMSRVVVHLKDAADGTPITASGRLQVSGSGLEKVCRGQGPTLRCGSIPPGDYELDVHAGDYVRASLQLGVDPLQRRLYEATLSMTAETPLWASIEVNLRDAVTKAPIPGTQVRFESSAEKSRSTTTTTGAVRINQVLAGNCTVSATARGYRSASRQLAVDPARNSSYAVSLYLQPDPKQETSRERPPEEPESVAREERPDPPKRDPEPPRVSKAEQCYSRHAETVARARKSNAANDPNGNVSTVVLGASDGCYKAYEACRERVWQKGQQCWRAGNPPDKCNPLINGGNIACAQEEVTCSAGVYRQKCGLEREERKPRNEAEACYARYAQTVARARKSNASNDPSGHIATVVLGGSTGCTKSYEACQETAWQTGQRCFKSGNPPSVCNTKVQSAKIACAQAEVSCSAQAFKQKCGLH
jgi:hypothetical protein